MIICGDKTYETTEEFFNDIKNTPISIKEKIKYFFIRQHRKIKNVYYIIKYAFQRMFRGYSDDEVYDIDYTFIKRYTKILKKFRNTTHSYPDYLVGTYENWLKTLDEMVSYFELADKNSDYYCEEYFDYKYLDSRWNEQTAYYYRKKALDMIVKYFDDLWD